VRGGARRSSGWRGTGAVTGCQHGLPTIGWCNRGPGAGTSASRCCRRSTAPAYRAPPRSWR